MAAPPLTVGLVKAGQIPAASGDSQIYATVSWGDAAAESTRVTAGVAQEDWGASVDLPQPSSGLEQAVAMHPYFSIDIFAADLVGSTLRARLLLPIMSLAQTPQLKARWTMGPGPGVVATKGSASFGQLDATIDASSELLAALVAVTAAIAVPPQDADRLERLGQFNVQPSMTTKATISVPGEEPTELVVKGIMAEVSGFKHTVSLRMVPSQLLVLDKQQQSGGADLTMAVPRGCITKVSLQASGATAQLCLDCKDFRVVTFHASSPETVAALSGLHGRITQWTAQLGEERAALTPQAIKRWSAAAAAVGDDSPGWELDMGAEFDRQLGGSWQDEASEFRDGGNSDFSLCDTYPKLVLVPKRASAELTSKCSDFRSKNRLPCLSWYSPTACIYRCSQPMTGPLSTHSPHDEEYVGLLREVGGSGSSKLLTIFDCRSHSAAAANSLKGAGLEDPARYVGCERVFLDIGNIHAMRHSLDALMDLIVSDVQEFDDHEESWLPKLSASGWLNHIRLLLGSALEVALIVRDGGHALVHCSDGWDRTSQICGLAQLLLDPYFRTIEGFRVLIQKDFVGFGHMCRKRLGTVTHQDQRSPCLLQFFECAHHIRAQAPHEFVRMRCSLQLVQVHWTAAGRY
jgi:hypothetical protein